MTRRSAIDIAGDSRGAAASGAIARLVDTAFDNPATSGGLLVMTLTVAAIVTNAMFLQTVRHPDPLFMTRPAPAATAAVSTAAPGLEPAPPVPLPRTRAEDARPLPPPVPAAAPGADTALIVAIQRELARQGLYAGTIDGIAGSRTRAAIAAYEATAGLPVTGEPDAALLAAIDDPVPAADPPTPTATIAAPEQHGDAGVVGGAPAVADPAATGQRYRRVQAALNQSGYGPIAVDGRPGAETAAAIRRFELDNGLDITGEAGDVVIARLVTIGAIRAP